VELYENVIEKFRAKQARVAILGVGYAGLPLACAIAEAGFVTTALDIDMAKIEALRRGVSYIGHIAPERISVLVRARKLCPSFELADLTTSDAAIICVPTPLTDGRMPDLTAVVNTSKFIAQHLHVGQLVVLESTTYPGTTEEVVLPILGESGLKVGQDFFLAFSPEREDPANPQFSTRTVPKVIGGVTPKCLAVALAAYGQVVQNVVPASSTRSAEAAKLLENVYRCVNVALINELKLLLERMDIDVWEVIRLASTKPFGFTPFYPGPGLGGHCIPIDPFYLSWKARQYEMPTRFIELAGEINSAMPLHVIDRLTDALNVRGKALRDARILLVGVAYKRDVEDTRESPALTIIKLLEAKLACVNYYDPHVPRLRSRHLQREFLSVELDQNTITNTDAVVIVTDHSSVDYEWIVEHAELVIDTRGVTKTCRGSTSRVVTA
jgi:UDP-N-acetyl-D-glucosamine dehydrogenase